MIRLAERLGTSFAWYAATVGTLAGAGAGHNLTEPGTALSWTLVGIAATAVLTMSLPALVVAAAGMRAGRGRRVPGG